MDTRTAERSTIAVLAGALVTLGLVRAAARLTGFIALLGIVLGTVAAFAILILVLRLLVQH
ncbi:MAG: hypothetical protein HIU86_08315 [Acidobacteria bacterium]|nr:hypothetical protein [Acidobacteriota bacterium]